MLYYLKRYLIALICIVLTAPICAQSTFEFVNDKKQVKIPFELISNLIVIPVKVNGVELSFLLDTGVKETILFNVSKVDSLTLNNAKTFTVKGANDIKVTAIKSENNLLEIKGLKSFNHDIYVAFNQISNLSSYLGEEIHGILGYHFFKDFIVELSYKSELIRVYKNGRYKKKWGRYEIVDLEFTRGKPYIWAGLGGKQQKFLLDTGMSDGLWKFKEDSLSMVNYGYYEDYLGMSVSGEILGKRSKIEKLVFAGETFYDVKISYPYEDTLPQELKGVVDRSGSLGGELLKRFTVVFDYGRLKMYLKGNTNIDNPFYYNKSGIVLRQDGEAALKNQNNDLLKNLENQNFIYFVDISYLLNPEFIIDNIREGSPAFLAGVMKDDVLLEVNGVKTYRYSLKKINALFYGEDDTLVRFKLERNGRGIDKEFRLKSPLKKAL